MQVPAPHHTTTTPLRRRRAWAFAAAFVLIIATIGIAALALRSDNTAATDGIETSEIESLQWSYVGLNSILDATQTVEDVTVGGPGLVAVGHQLRNAAVWTSPNGLTWTQVPYQHSFWEGRMTAVTTGGPGLIAVGFLTDNAYSAMVWTSPDGITWSRLPSTPDLTGDGGERAMLDVIAGGPGFVAVGSWDTAGDVFAPSAAVWTSPDGINWTRVPHDETVFFGGTPGAVMVSVTTGGPGLVAVGNIGGLSDWHSVLGEGGPGEPDGNADGWRAAVWTSPDGITWTPVPDANGVFSEDESPIIMMESVTAGGPGLVAVGGDRVWTSADGFNWSCISSDEMADGWFELRHVTAIGSGLVAVGATDYGADEAKFVNEVGRTQSRAIWTSGDGLTWNQVSYDYVGTDAIVEGHLAIGLGTGRPAIIPVGNTVWLATPRDPIAAPASRGDEVRLGMQATNPLEPWDLVFISDSSGRGIADSLAEVIERETIGVQVNVHDHAQPNLSAAAVRALLRDEAFPLLAERIREAEVIVIYSIPNRAASLSQEDRQSCNWMTTSDSGSPEPATEAEWRAYRRILDRIYTEIWQLRGDAPVYLLTADQPNPDLADQRAAGTDAECTAFLEEQSAVIRQAAAANGATFVSILDLLNGPNHDVDPQKEGWIGLNGIHPSNAGKEFIVEAMATAVLEPGD